MKNNALRNLAGRYSEQFESTMDLYTNGCHPAYQDEINAAIYGKR